MNYNKNELIDECLARYYQTFAITLDTADYVPKGYNKKIQGYIFRSMKNQFKKINREDKLYQKAVSDKERLVLWEERLRFHEVERKEKLRLQVIADKQKRLDALDRKKRIDKWLAEHKRIAKVVSLFSWLLAWLNKYVSIESLVTLFKWLFKRLKGKK